MIIGFEALLTESVHCLVANVKCDAAFSIPYISKWLGSFSKLWEISEVSSRRQLTANFGQAIHKSCLSSFFARPTTGWPADCPRGGIWASACPPNGPASGLCAYFPATPTEIATTAATGRWDRSQSTTWRLAGSQGERRTWRKWRRKLGSCVNGETWRRANGVIEGQREARRAFEDNGKGRSLRKKTCKKRELHFTHRDIGIS